MQPLARHLADAWNEARAGIAIDDGGLGIIFASTKGAIEDVIWSVEEDDFTSDTIAPVLTAFLAITALKPARTLCISNACTSVLVALQQAQTWIRAGIVTHVLVLSADQAGPFVANGFASLRSVAPDRVEPFGVNRRGIQLGDAAAAILVAEDPAGFPLTVDTRVEGYALTRSAAGGATLQAACRAVAVHASPDAIIAHATGTIENDRLEDRVYSQLYPGVPVTATKWSIGHTLGASGAVDIIAACESLRRQTLFRIANTKTIDPSLCGTYLHGSAAAEARVLNRILVGSAGFGGMHGAALVEREGSR